MSTKRLIILLLFGCCLFATGEGVSAGELRFLPVKTTQAPPPRFDQAMATDREGGRVFLFGGRDGKRFFNDLWVLDQKKMSWSKIEIGQGPSRRSGSSLVYDQKSRRLILYGGFTTTELGQIKFFRQLWIYSDADGWNREYFKLGPSGRAWHGAAMLGGKLVIFGGYSGGPHPFLNDVWRLDLDNLSFERCRSRKQTGCWCSEELEPSNPKSRGAGCWTARRTSGQSWPQRASPIRHTASRWRTRSRKDCASSK